MNKVSKLISFIILLVISLLLFSCADTNDNEKPVDPSPVNPTPIVPNNPEPNKDAKHLILDVFGNYGGTTNRSKYGYGSPLNGEYDIKDTEYYEINDYYNMDSTDTRTIIKEFAPYQQTMSDSDGLSCALMVLNYSKEDVYSEYTELNLLKDYEELNKYTVYKNGTTSNGLVKLFKEYGYNAYDANYLESGKNTSEKIDKFNAWIKGELENSHFVFVRFQDGMKFSWHIIIGYDDMGTTYGKDDVLIMADPFDNLDHYQDGYSITPSGRFYRWWGNVLDSGEVLDAYDGFIVEAKEKIVFNRVKEEVKQYQVVPERHLILNPDGSFGGSTDISLYGEIPEANGETDTLSSCYYSFVDYYNMTSTKTKYILPHYQAFQQTMASSCGICSTLSVLNYYGLDVTKYNEVYLTNKYCEVNDKETIYNVGVGSSGIKKLVATLGLNCDAASYSKDKYVDETSKIFVTFDDFSQWVINNLSNDTPMPVSWRPQNGHWQVIIGYDTMGTDYTYDDVIVLADSHDTFDHYQDGYNTLPAHLFYRQWFNGSYSYNQQYAVVYRK